MDGNANTLQYLHVQLCHTYATGMQIYWKCLSKKTPPAHMYAQGAVNGLSSAHGDRQADSAISRALPSDSHDSVG